MMPLIFAFLFAFFATNLAHSTDMGALNIQQAVELGLKNNLEVLSAKMDVSIAEANEITAALRKNPSLFLDSQLMPFSGQWHQASSGGPTQRDVVLSVPLDISGKRSQRKVIAKILTEKKKIEFFIYQLQKAKEIKNRFVEILAADAKINVLQEHRQLLEKVTKIIRNRIKNTNSQPLMVGRVDIFARKVDFNLRDMMITRNQQARDFCIILGERTDCTVHYLGGIEGFLFKEPVAQDILKPEAQKDLLKFIDENNPFAKQLAREGDSLVAERKLIRQDIWDDIVLSAGMSQQERQGLNPLINGSRDLDTANSWMVGITLPLPVFDRNQGETLRADYSILQIEKQKTQLEYVLENQVKSLFSLAQYQNEKISEYEKAILPSARKINTSAQNSFRVGSMTVLEYLDANQVFIESYNEYYDLIAERADTEFQLQMLKGQM